MHSPHCRSLGPYLFAICAISTLTVDVARSVAQEPTGNGNGRPAEGETTLFVDTDAQGAGDGTSWADAFTDVQDALEVAGAGDHIWVAAGTYNPDRGTGDFTMSFEMVSSAALFGGFAGTETSPDQRDIEANETILSGDLTGAYEDRSCHVVAVNATAEGTLIDGVTIADGFANTDRCTSGRGGGIVIVGGHITFRQCKITGNLTGCKYYANTCGGPGGGIYADDATIMFIDSDLVDNFAGGYFGTPCGGGLFKQSTVVFVNCNITDNAASSGGSDISGGRGGDGGALCVNGSDTTLVNCFVANNAAGDGGTGGGFGSGGRGGKGGGDRW